MTETQSAGAWVVYEHDYTPYAISLHSSAEDAARATAPAGYGRIAWWAFEDEFVSAVIAWEKRP